MINNLRRNQISNSFRIPFQYLLFVIIGLCSCSEQKEVIEPEVSLKTGSMKQIIHNTAECNGNRLIHFNEAIVERGVCWNTTGNPSIESENSLSTSDSTHFDCLLDNLTPNTTYYVKAFVNDGEDIIYGSSIEFTTSKEYTPVVNEFIDPRDQQVYATVEIGNQVWFAENLNYDSEDSWWYSEKEEYGIQYGRFYLWDAAASACPDGWHLPSDFEWKQLEVFLGMSPEQVDMTELRGINIAEKLKSTEGWNNQGIGNNISGLNITPAGVRCSHGHYSAMGGVSRFWSSTEETTENVWTRVLLSSEDKVERRHTPKNRGHSVRCVKDSN